MADNRGNRRGSAAQVSDASVGGAEDFLKLSKALKAAGETELRKELNTELRRAAKPLIPMTRQAARSRLPQRGGLAESVARAPQRVQVRTGEKTAGVRLVVASRRAAARAANRGLIRHPVFADAAEPRKDWTWVEQKVQGGWFDETVEREAPRVARPAIEQALESIAEKVVREVKRGG